MADEQGLGSVIGEFLFEMSAHGLRPSSLVAYSRDRLRQRRRHSRNSQTCRQSRPRGRVDPSPVLLAVARELAREAGFGDRVEFREGNALHLTAWCVDGLESKRRGKKRYTGFLRWRMAQWWTS